MELQSPDIKEIQEEYRVFPDEFQSLLMATCNSLGMPEASYAAYMEEAGNYYIYLSELARHTDNLQTNPHCSILFIESEQDASHLFARRRLSYQCDSQELLRGTQGFNAIMDKFETKFGEFIKMLRKLEDFHLFRLRPKRGKYVAGFAQAYEISGEKLEWVKHRNEQGHRGSDVQIPQTRTQITSQK